MKLKTIIIIVIAVLIAVGGTVTAVVMLGEKDCEHEWAEATCTSPKTCKLCEETEGDPAGHSYGAWVGNGDGTHTKTCSRDSSHKVNENCSGGSATCTDKAVCISCSEEYGELGDHSFGEWTPNGDGTHTRVCAYNEEHTETEGCAGGSATCEEKAKCSICGGEHGEYAGHTFGSTFGHDETHHWLVPSCSHEGEKKDVTVHQYTPSVTEPTCTEDGYTTYTCVCGRSYVGDEVDASGHEYNGAYGYNGSEHWRKASCGHDGETSVPEAHNFTSTVTNPTCTEKGYTTYSCACGYSYVSDFVDENGHSVPWQKGPSVISNPLNCEYTVSYSGECSVCHTQQTKTETVEQHSFYWEVVTTATCGGGGKKVQICASEECKFHSVENPNATMDYTDAENHVWVVESENGSVITYKCQNHPDKTKTVASSTGNKAEGVDVGAVDEVNVSNISIGFDDDVKGNAELSGGVSVGVETLEGSAKEDAMSSANLSEEQKSLIGDKPIYDFSVVTKVEGDDKEISDLGGYVTVKIPYEIKVGDNPDKIIVWYINEEENKIESIDAVYENGYVVFKTDHFSYYVPAELTPEQYCAEMGHPQDELKVVSATCLSEGYTICLHCGEIVEKLKKLDHVWSVETIVTPTCDTVGETKHECLLCKTSYTATVAATGHHYALSDVVSATCKVNGKEVYSCIYCSRSYEIQLAKLKHDYAVSVIDPTCEEVGYTEKTCKTCGDITVFDVKDKLGHLLDTVWHTAEEGHYHVCTRCGQRGEVEAHEEGAPATEASAQICTVCEYIITPPLAHTHKLTKVDEIKATCTENGRIAYYVCECGKWFLDEGATQLITDHSSVYVLSSGHKLENVPAKDPTCTETGYTAGLYCTECKTYIRGHVEVSAYGHSYAIEQTAPTCTEVGKTVYTCHCGDTYTEYGTETRKHNYDKTVIAPTCEEGGKTIYTCLYCKDTYDGDEKAPLGHKFSTEWKASADKHYKECTVCGKKDSEADHIPDYAEATEEHGITCTVCRYVLADALNHEHSVRVTIPAKEPTCTESGSVARYVCRCGKSFFDEACTKEGIASEFTVPALGHERVEFKQEDPTCAEVGYTAGVYCDRCKIWLSGHVEIPATGNHEYKDGKCEVCDKPCEHLEMTSKRTEPTCSEEGYIVYTCVCGHTQRESLGKLDHTWIDATCTAKKHCSVCGEEEGDFAKHVMSDTAVSDGKGNHIFTCVSCNEYSTVEKCSGGEATCKAPAKCDICHTEYGELGDHAFANGVCIHCGEIEEVEETRANVVTVTVEALSDTEYKITVSVVNPTVAGVLMTVGYDSTAKVVGVDYSFADLTYNEIEGAMVIAWTDGKNFEGEELVLMSFTVTTDPQAIGESIRVIVQEIYAYDSAYEIIVPEYHLSINY